MVKVHTPAAVVGPHVAGGGVLGVGLTLKLGFTPDTPVHTLLPELCSTVTVKVWLSFTRFVSSCGVMLMRKSFHVFTPGPLFGSVPSVVTFVKVWPA